MPEICELTLLSHYLYRHLKNKTIQNIHIIDPKYQYLTKPTFHTIFTTYPITDISSYGKHLYFKFKKNKKSYYLLFHFKLTGILDIIESTSTRFILEFPKFNIYYNDQTKLGQISLLEPPDFESTIQDLAPDFFQDSSIKSIKSRLNKIQTNYPRRNIYTVLGEQKEIDNKNKIISIGSGLGNYLILEILYHAKISPHRKLNSLSKKDITNLTTAIIYTLKWSYRHNISKYLKNIRKYFNFTENIKNEILPNYYEETDETIIIPNKKFEYNVYENEEVKVEKKSSRTIYWDDTVQK